MKKNFSSSVINDYISTSSYYRILLPKLLPNISKIIYTDCDVINFEDLTNMYNLTMSDDIFFMGGLDYIGHKDELNEYGIVTDMYMNSGILLMNLESLRKSDKYDELVNLCKNSYLEHHDQTAINVIYHNNIKKLPIKYTLFNFNAFEDLVNFNNEQNEKVRYDGKELKDAYNHPVLLHFVGYDKPWGAKKVKFRKYWWYYAKKSLFYPKILQKYNFRMKDADEIIKKIHFKRGLFRRKIKKI